ncbi:MAG TPA: hypothetical protein VM120_21135 [Bryobacteraceae bacterium]|nr:hypothetical protein [Bryobacteraceae bacterium]
MTHEVIRASCPHCGALIEVETGEHVCSTDNLAAKAYEAGVAQEINDNLKERSEKINKINEKIAETITKLPV